MFGTYLYQKYIKFWTFLNCWIDERASFRASNVYISSCGSLCVIQIPSNFKLIINSFLEYVRRDYEFIVERLPFPCKGATYCVRCSLHIPNRKEVLKLLRRRMIYNAITGRREQFSSPTGPSLGSTLFSFRKCSKVRLSAFCNCWWPALHLSLPAKGRVRVKAAQAVVWRFHHAISIDGCWSRSCVVNSRDDAKRRFSYKFIG